MGDQATPGTEEQQKGGQETTSPPEGPKGAAEPVGSQPSVPTSATETPPIAPEASPPDKPADQAPAPAPDPRDAQIAELQAQVTGLKAAHSAALAEVQRSLTDQLANASNHYKTLALASNPDVPADLVEGATIEQVQQSLEKARGVVAKVKAQLAAQAAGAVPAGAPVRNGPDVEGMDALSKIKYAINKRKP